MAKIDWQMDYTVMPADMNQIGQEINDLTQRQQVGTLITINGFASLDYLTTPGYYISDSAHLADLPPSISYGYLVLISVTKGSKNIADSNPILIRQSIRYLNFYPYYEEGWIRVAEVNPNDMNVSWQSWERDTSTANKVILDAATNAVTANTIIKRDASGRAKVAAPSATDDIARKAEVDEVQTNLTAHANNSTVHITAAERTNWNAKASTAVVTTSADGLMSAADKTKLNGIATGAQVNRTIATQAQAEAGTDNTTDMTPLRVAQAITKRTGDLTSLTTTNKTNLVAAINEVKQDGSEWKSDVAGAITASGVPTAATASRVTFVKNIGKLLIRPGMEWTKEASTEFPLLPNQMCVAIYGGSAFIVYSPLGSAGKLQVSKDNGYTWSRRTDLDTIGNFRMAYSPELMMFVAVGTNSASNFRYSYDLNTWSQATAGLSGFWTDVAWGGSEGNKAFVAVASGTSFGRSVDGVTWIRVTGIVSRNWIAICSGGGKFVVLDSDTVNPLAAVSSDGGSTWEMFPLPALVYGDIAYGNGLFVAVAANNAGSYATSPDGINWTKRTISPAGNYLRITFGNGIFVAISVDNGRIITSPDGINWTVRRDAVSSSGWSGLAAGQGCFIAASAAEGAIPRCLLSGYDYDIGGYGA